MSSWWWSIGVWVANIVVGGVVGGYIKSLFDRRIIRELKDDRKAVQEQLTEAKKERQAAQRARDKAFTERQKAVEDLAVREDDLRRKGDELAAAQDKLAAQQERFDRLLGTLRSNDAGLWTTFPKKPPFPDFDVRVGRRKPIILTVANNKGGVGKTTVVGNLLAYFDKKGKSVLAIDMDYQGSLSTMLQGQQDATVQTGTSNVNVLLQREADVASLFTVARGLGSKLTRSSFVSAFYDLALFEDRMMVEWLLQENGGEDVRYRLASVLLQPQVQQRYDIIIIDVPPRLTAGTINALCTSTHVLIPTIFNPIAAEPVPNFLGAATGLLNNLNPTARFVGIVETMAPPDNQGQPPRERARGTIEAALRSHPGIGILQSVIPRRVPISEGGIAYLANDAARAIFDELGDEISQRIGL